jgi:hypothetical protein
MKWPRLVVFLLAGMVSCGGALAADTATIYTKDIAPPAPKLDDLPLQQSLSQYGITWTFDKPVPVGQFINGDWYVVGPVTVKAIDPEPLFGEEVKNAPEEQGDSREGKYKPQYARNGSTLNLPAVVPRNKVTPRTSRSGFDSRMPMDAYDPNQFTPLPIAMKPGDSLVSSASAEPYNGYPIQAIAVLTCAAQPQPADAFRPSYCQSASCKQYLARNLRRDLLLNLPRPASAAKVSPRDYAGAGYFQDPWIDTVGYGRAMPRKKFAFYGPSIAELGGVGSLLLLLDYPPAEKEPLLVHMVQTGIDLHGLLRGGAGWPAEGGGAEVDHPLRRADARRPEYVRAVEGIPRRPIPRGRADRVLPAGVRGQEVRARLDGGEGGLDRPLRVLQGPLAFGEMGRGVRPRGPDPAERMACSVAAGQRRVSARHDERGLGGGGARRPPDARREALGP